jgi:hypothetical protein
LGERGGRGTMKIVEDPIFSLWEKGIQEAQFFISLRRGGIRN